MDLKATLIAVLAVMPLGGSCNASASSLSAKDSGNIARFGTVDGRVRSTLARSEHAGEERLHGVTELETGARLEEDATLDAAGTLRWAQAVLSAADGSTLTRVRFDRERGTVEVNDASLHVEWNVPRDFPWIWAPLSSIAPGGAPIATPLDARVVSRAAAHGRTVRLLDLGALRSYSLTSDQVLVPGDSGSIVVLGDDTSEIEDGMPKRLQLKALQTELARFDPPAVSPGSKAFVSSASSASSASSDALLAAVGWSPARGSFAR